MSSENQEKQVKRLLEEIERLKENVYYPEYLKIKDILEKGQAVDGMIRGKAMTAKRMIAELKRNVDNEKDMQEDFDEQEEEPQMPVKRKAAKKIELSEKDLGLMDDIEGLPDDDEQQN